MTPATDMNAFFSDTMRRLDETLSDAARVQAALGCRAHEYAFALLSGEYAVCRRCGAWGLRLELGAGEEAQPGGGCHHPIAAMTRRACWLVVTCGGNVVPLTDDLLAPLSHDQDRPGEHLLAGGVVVASLAAGPNQVPGEPVYEVDELLVLAPSRRTLRHSHSVKRSWLRATDPYGPHIYTAPQRPPNFPL